MKDISKNSSITHFEHLTPLSHTWLNAIQDEICSVIAEAGFELNKNGGTELDNQLSQAIDGIFSDGNFSNFIESPVLTGDRVAIKNFILDRRISDSFSFKVYLDLELAFQAQDTPTTFTDSVASQLAYCLYLPIPIEYDQNAMNLLRTETVVQANDAFLKKYIIEMTKQFYVIPHSFPDLEEFSFVPFSNSTDLILKTLAQHLVAFHQPIFEVFVRFDSISNKWTGTFYCAHFDISKFAGKVVSENTGNQIITMPQLFFSPIILTVDSNTGAVSYQYNKMLYRNNLNLSFGIFDLQYL